VLQIINAEPSDWTRLDPLWHHAMIVDSPTSKPLAETAEPTYRIRVDVETSYLEEQSDPRERKFVFSYTITLRNEGRVPAKLLTRHWIITDANGKVQEVRGDGVVGEQPHLKPGQGFRYSSGAMIETPVGAMQGSYQMVADDGARFDAPIAPFRLAMPGILQ
jgi:ApaG protein